MNSQHRQLRPLLILQPLTAVVAVTLAAIVSVLAYLIAYENNQAYDSARSRGRALADTFEQYVSNAIKSADDILLLARSHYQAYQDPELFLNWLQRSGIADSAMRVTLIGSDGKIRFSSTTNLTAGLDVSDRSYFRIHASAPSSDLFISEPLQLRSTGRWSIILSRRIDLPDGSFGGVINAAFDYVRLENFLTLSEGSKGGFVSLIGLDGVIRARAVNGRLTTDAIGKSLPDAHALRLYKEAPSGSYWTEGGVFEQGRRLVNYRLVNGFPLIVVVAQLEHNVFAQAKATRSIYYGFGAAVAVTILIASGFGVIRTRQLASAANVLANTNVRFSAALQYMSQGLCMFDASQRVVVANEQFQKLYDFPPELVQPGLALSVILQHHADSTADVSSYFSEGTKIRELSNGRVVLIQCRNTADGGWLTTHEDITERRKQEKQVLFMAHHDALTGLLNRGAFLERMEAACRRGDAFAVFLLDLDRFKEVNDTLGHPAGDALLKQVADRLLTTLREQDILARLGGDEFAIVQSANAKPADSAGALADRIVELIAQPFHIDGEVVSIGTSIGIVLCPEHASTGEQLLKIADLALYQTKSQGRNGYTVFDPALSEAVQSQQRFEAELRRAIEHNELELHYQPIVDTNTLEMCGAEALVRWRHPERGLIYPDQFIPAAESCGLIARIGEWVLVTACMEASGWPSPTKIAVNLSAVQFRIPGLVDHVICALVQSGLPPGRLEIEITETALVENQIECLSILRQFKSLGISVALDDFGTGYSSLSQLTMFPFDKIKIDKSFTLNMTKRADCAAIISAVLALARSLDITTTAEGVETKEQLMLLAAAGVSTVQGYLIKHPVPASELGFDPSAVRHGVEDAA